MKFNAIIFDWDGTLGMTLHLWLEAYRTELKNLGLNFSDELIISDIFYEHNKAAIKYPEINFPSFVTKVHKYMVEHVSSMKLYNGTREMLEKLKNNNVTMALVTSSPRKLIEKELEQTGLVDFFSVVISSDEMEHHKPDPEAFNDIIKILKLKLGDVLILGDAENDILAAKAAGLSSCLFLPTENKIFYDFEKLKETNRLIASKL